MNTVEINLTKFQARTGEVQYGFRILDDQTADWSDVWTMEDYALSPRNALKKILRSVRDEKAIGMIERAELITVDGQVFHPEDLPFIRREIERDAAKEST